VTSVAVSHDGHCLLASCMDGAARLLDKEGGDLLATYRGAVTFCPLAPVSSFLHSRMARRSCWTRRAATCWQCIEVGSSLRPFGSRFPLPAFLDGAAAAAADGSLRSGCLYSGLRAAGLSACACHTQQLAAKDGGRSRGQHVCRSCSVYVRDLKILSAGHKHTSYKLDSCLTPTDAHVVSGSEDGEMSPHARPAAACAFLVLQAPQKPAVRYMHLCWQALRPWTNVRLHQNGMNISQLSSGGSCDSLATHLPGGCWASGDARAVCRQGVLLGAGGSCGGEVVHGAQGGGLLHSDAPGGLAAADGGGGRQRAGVEVGRRGPAHPERISPAAVAQNGRH
jgi:hypothetical protein